MKTNMGKMDRMIRLFVAAVIFALYISENLSGTGGIILMVIAGIFTVTSLLSYCPLYAVLGLSTCEVKKV